MKRYLIAAILVLSGNALFAQTTTIRYYYDKNNRMTGYVYEELFQRGFEYDPTGNVIGRNNENPATGADEIPSGENECLAVPNPFGESGFRILLPVDVKTADIRLFDLTGKHVSVNYISGTHEVYVEAGHLAAGIYLCRITYDGFTCNIKVLRK